MVFMRMFRCVKVYTGLNRIICFLAFCVVCLNVNGNDTCGVDAMKAKEVKIGHVYIVKVSKKLAKVEITGESIYKGWNGRNLATGREVYIRTAGKLRREVV